MKIDLIEYMLIEISESNMTLEEKKEYIKRILKYMQMNIGYYKDMVVDSSLSSLFVGMGLGTNIMDIEYIPYILYGLGGATIIATAIKRKIKYKDIFENKTIIKTDEENK